MDKEQQNNIWKKIDILINNFKQYDLEKRIQYVAKNAVNLELNNLRARQIQPIKDIVEKKRQAEEYLKKFKKANEKKLIEEKQKKDDEHKHLQERREKKIKEKHIKESREHIQKTATNEVAAGLMASQIKKTAIQAIEDNVEKIKYPDDFHSDDDNYEDDFEDYSDDNFESTANKIKNTAIQAIKDKEDDELQVVEEIEYEEEKDIQNTATNAVATESTASQIKEAAKNAVINGVKTKNVAHDIATDIVSTALTNVNIKTLAKQIIMTFIKKYNSLRRAILAIKKAAIAALTNAVATKYNTELIQQTAIKKINDNVPRLLTEVAESNIDVKNPLIENYAINEVKDAVINDLRIKLLDTETKLKSTIEANVKRNLEEIAIKTVERETTGNTKTAPTSTTGPNIENDLKNAAIIALYRALLGVPREPVDISKKPDKYDVLITDKTYNYNDKGEPVEDTKLTKYDRILANLAKK
jgi:hypothetical protein